MMLRLSPSWWVITLVIVGSMGQPVTTLGQDQQARITMGRDTDEWREGSFSGSTPLDQISPACRGWVSEVPSLVLELELDGWVNVTLDPTTLRGAALMLMGGGEILCQHNEYDTESFPGISTFLTAGEYYVYAGRLALEDEGEYRIHVQAGPRASSTAVRPDRALQLSGTSSTEVPAGLRLEGCPGYVGQSPSHVLRLHSPMQLEISVQSSSDLVLLVGTSDGWRCSDDRRASLDPAIVGQFDEGFVRVHVGSHNPRIQAPYALTVTPQAAP